MGVIKKYNEDLSDVIQALPKERVILASQLIRDRIIKLEDTKEFRYFFEKPDFASEKSKKAQ